MHKLTDLLIFLFLPVIILLSGCGKEQKLFEPVLSEESGISFRNDLTINDTLNGVEFEYVYNGAGVAAGDVNNDGLDDLFFAGNMVSSRLYLNMGGFSFKDITAEAGVTTDKWCTGTSFVDINNDGLLDLYICVAGLGPADIRKNIFFIHQGLDENGIPRYVDLAADMNLDDDGYSTMAVFFDYDKDHDLDVYILTNAMEAKLRNALRPRRVDGEGPSTDKLYRNEADGRFTDVSREAGILQEGYGLGIGICDLNQDGWMDVYCSNDFLSNDLLWINNRDGTFSEESAVYFKHFTNNGMGMDIADYNNDGLLDIFVLDMLPMSNQRQKQMIGYRNLTRFYESIEMGYHPQFLRNTLQLNRGKFSDGQFRFSEIGYLTGAYQTDWSWSPLLADYDNDGWKDLSITNGYRKDVTNLDYIYFTIRENWMFGTPESKKELAVNAMNELPDVQLPNFMFKNNRDLTFTDKSSDWGLDYPTFTNGTAYADLDNDGDLDIVINNIDQEVILFKNLTSEKKKHGYVKLKFDRSVRDSEKIGLKVWAFHQDNAQYYEYSPYRGYKSTVGQEIIVGLGNSSGIDSLVVQWPDGLVRKWMNLSSDTTLYLVKSASTSLPGHIVPGFNTRSVPVRFEDRTGSYRLNVRHVENSRIDLDHIPIIMHNLGQYGPGMAVGDINGDGLDDIFVGNDSNVPGNLLFQNPDRTFTTKI
ncbi:MAG: CRTAC1 family protein, partial [Cyclobacteriaceae bacterium]|nr:CRTAC1 family protein [Cyclobacteriaceae bacterium]